MKLHADWDKIFIYSRSDEKITRILLSLSLCWERGELATGARKEKRYLALYFTMVRYLALFFRMVQSYFLSLNHANSVYGIPFYVCVNFHNHTINEERNKISASRSKLLLVWWTQKLSKWGKIREKQTFINSSIVYVSHIVHWFKSHLSPILFFNLFHHDFHNQRWYL